MIAYCHIGALLWSAPNKLIQYNFPAKARILILREVRLIGNLELLRILVAAVLIIQVPGNNNSWAVADNGCFEVSKESKIRAGADP